MFPVNSFCKLSFKWRILHYCQAPDRKLTRLQFFSPGATALTGGMQPGPHSLARNTTSSPVGETAIHFPTTATTHAASFYCQLLCFLLVSTVEPEQIPDVNFMCLQLAITINLPLDFKASAVGGRINDDYTSSLPVLPVIIYTTSESSGLLL